MGKRPLSVVHVTEPVDGGVGRHVLDAVGDQARRGWTVRVVSPPEERFAGAVRERGGEHVVWRVPVQLASDRDLARAARPALGTLPWLGRTLLAGEPDVVHLHSSLAGFAGRLALRGRPPTVFEPNGWSFLALAGRKRALAERWERLAARWTTLVVCVGEDERALGRQAGIGARMEVVPNAVDLAELTEASEEDRRRARALLRLGDEPLAVCVAALRPQKGQDVLVAAWPAVRAHVPEARLVLVGDGPDRAALERAAGDGVVFAGQRADVPEWLAAADVVVFPSRWEGMSFALLEAMARGRAVVATAVPGVREALGDAGAVVPPGERQALADAVVERLLDPARRAREQRAARRRAEEQHDLGRSLDALARLYRELTG